ncbi:MAG: hypothetical protein Q8Q48_00330 [Candidatus Staskawiczbacteria bacterium]|nr:hypothetical protein [Candidatus Staskawiczbacteria bacterium]
MEIKNWIEKLRALSDKQKKVVLWTIVVVLGVIFSVFWVNSAMKRFSEMGQVVGQIEFPSLEMPDIGSVLETTSPSDQPVVAQTIDWKTYTSAEYGFEIKYPADWTYQVFNCNLNGIAFCSLATNNPSFCGQTCGADSPYSPIYFYITPNISSNSLILHDESYKEVYNKMISTFKFIE